MADRIEDKIRKSQPLQFGYELGIRLRESGTGEGKLDIIRELLARKPTASAEEVFIHMKNSGRVHPKTLEKARTLIEEGTLPAEAAVPEKPIFLEDELKMLQGKAAEQQKVADAAAANPVKAQIVPQPKPTPEQIAEIIRDHNEKERLKLEHQNKMKELEAGREKADAEKAAAEAEKARIEAEEKAAAEEKARVEAEAHAKKGRR